MSKKVKKQNIEIEFLQVLDRTQQGRELLGINEKLAFDIYCFINKNVEIDLEWFIFWIGFAYDTIYSTCLKLTNTEHNKESTEKFNKFKKWQSLLYLVNMSLLCAPRKTTNSTDSMDLINEFYDYEGKVALQKLKQIDMTDELWERVERQCLINLDFIFPQFNLNRKFDILHFLICAFNYKVNFKKELQIAIEDLNDLRNELILVAVREENYSDDLLKRISQVRNEDKKIEEKWADLNSSFFTQSETAVDDEQLDKKVKSELTVRQWVIAMRFFINHFNLNNIVTNTDLARLLAVMNNGKNQQEFRRQLGNSRNLITKKTTNEAQIIANHFSKQNLKKIAEDIENEISKIKDKNL